jgi:hypothetical protein
MSKEPKKSFIPLTIPYTPAVHTALATETPLRNAYHATSELLSCVYEFLVCLRPPQGPDALLDASSSASEFFPGFIHRLVTQLLTLTPRCEALVKPFCDTFAEVGQNTSVGCVQELSAHAAVLSFGQWILRELWCLSNPGKRWHRHVVPPADLSVYEDKWWAIVEHFARHEPVNLAELSSLLYKEFVKATGQHGPRAGGPMRPEQPQPDKRTLALAALARIGPNVAKIAREINVPRTTLLGWPTFRQALDKMRATGEKARRSRRRGRRAGDRDFEVEEDE